METAATDDQLFSVTPFVRDGCRVLVLEGELDMIEAPKLDAALELFRGDVPTIVDVSRLEFIDSSGLHVLLQRRDGARPAGLVQAPGSNVSRVLAMVRAALTIPVYDDLASAEDAVSSTP